MYVIPVVNCPDAPCAKEKIEVAKTFLAKGDLLHFDVTDGIFTFHKTWNNPTEWANFHSPFDAEVHLMVKDPQPYIDPWLAAGAKRFIVHVETINEDSLKSILKKIEHHGGDMMLSSNPETPVEEFLPYRLILRKFQVLSVYPGPAAQKFLPLALDKVRFLRERFQGAIIEVDGGINPETIKLVKDAGADTVVSASYIFGSKDPKKAYQELKAV